MVRDGVGQWWLWFLAWVTVVVVFFFFGCDRCLKGLWVVVRSDVWDVVGLWLRWVMAEVGRWSWIGELVWIGGLGSVDGGFETMDLLIGGWIGWVDHR